MIKLTNLNKYFNKGKQNEIHVINDTSLEFPNKGLISLLGESGSGKTTLLNVIGGLDKTSGTIEFKDERISFYNTRVWDELRVHNIGYIFQNYHLLDNKTVYENVKMVLTLMGINDQEEVDYKVNYVLKQVGMDRFKNRRATDLSGGQKQRVAIARAIVKNPDVIIADEPTGNLDTNNSIEVLKIIKEISKEKLVILVTHNKDLANNYSDRIINIVDGRVVEDTTDVSSTGSLKYIDNNLYLKDLNHVNNKNINIYSDSDIEDLDFTIVKVNNNYYLQTKTKNATIRVINDKSDVKLIDDHKENLVDKHFTETDFTLEELEKYNKEKTKKEVYTLKDSFKEAFRKLTNLGRKGKLQIVALIYLGFMFVNAFLMLTSVLFIDTSKIYVEKTIYYTEYGKTVTINDLPDDTIVFTEPTVQLSKGSFNTYLHGVNIAPKAAIGKEDYDDNTVIIDISLLDKDYEQSYIFNAFGVYNEKDLLRQNITIAGFQFKISSTENTGTKTVYVSENALKNISLDQRRGSLKLLPSNLVIDEDISHIKISENEDYEKILKGNFGVYIPITQKNNELEFYDLYNENFNLLGYYETNDEEASTIYLKEENYTEFLISDRFSQNLFYTKSQNVSEKLTNKYDNLVENIKYNKSIGLATSIAQSLIALGVGVLIFYFLVRSSLTRRRKEISVLRSLGISKSEVRKLFAIEYLVMTTFTSLIGVLVGGFVINKLSTSALSDFIQINVNLLTMSMAIVLIYIVNIIVSLIPVNNILRKTPAELLTSYDI